MMIQTSRFGPLEVDETRLIRFPKGILGFPDQQEYALIQTAEKSPFYWLQAVQRADLAFVVCDPRLFVPDYVVPVKLDELSQIGLNDPRQPRCSRSSTKWTTSSRVTSRVRWW